MFPYKYIAIEGNIGAGKTSLAQILATKYNAELALEEFADNTFLAQFYQNPERWAFPLELSFLAERYQQLKQKQDQQTATGGMLVTDYLFEKSLLFAQVNLQGGELELFNRFYSLMKPNLKTPDLVLYLARSTNALINNIRKRGRDFEKDISIDYLSKVSVQYQDHLKQQHAIPVLFVESDTLDFVNRSEDLRYIIALLSSKHNNGVAMLHP